jgi:hypothetical protein
MGNRFMSLFALSVLVAGLSSAAGQAPAAPAAAGSQASGGEESVDLSTIPPALVGVWKSAPERTELTGAFEESVWGRDAASERSVELRIADSGEAVLVVTNRILDARGRVIPGPTSIEESRLRIGGPVATAPVGTDHAVTVVSAERRYPDDPAGQWTLEGLKVRVITREERDGIEIRYDTPEGRGSFWETLTRDGKAAPRRESARRAGP